METVAEADSYYSHDLSPDNQRVVWALVTEPSGFGDLWVKDLERGTRLRLTNDAGWGYSPRFWPDGSRIAFTWGQPLRHHLAIKPANGSGSEERVLESPAGIYLDDVSPDGAYLLYSENGPPSALWVLPLAGDRRPILYRRGEGDNRDGKFSRDGHWIVYASTDSGRSEIHVQDFQPGAAGTPTRGDLTVVSTEGGSRPRWSADGKELFYLATDNSLVSVPVKTGRQFSTGRPEKLFQLGAPQPLERIPARYYRIPYVPSADGRRFLIAVPEGGVPESGVLVLTNWMEALVR